MRVLDAPDLLDAASAVQPAADPTKRDPYSNASDQRAASSPLRPPEKRARPEQRTQLTLPPDASQTVLHQVMGELKLLNELETLATWAHRVLPLKNQLSKKDAQTVEDAFAGRLNEVGDPASVELRSREARGGEGAEPGAARVITIDKPVRERDRNHLRFCCHSTVPYLRKDAIGRASPQICRTGGDGTQSQRQVHRSRVQGSPSRSP